MIIFDLYYIYGFDANTSVEETLRALDNLVGSGKVGYIGCSNFSGWHLMKSLAVSEKYGWHKLTIGNYDFYKWERSFLFVGTKWQHKSRHFPYTVLIVPNADE